jgi:tetratricopeptide (TPR) repeat protein
MAGEPQLAAAGGPRKVRVILFLLVVLLTAPSAFGQEQLSNQARQAAAQDAVNAGRWEEALHLAHGPGEQPPELDLLLGLAWAHFEKWSEAKLAFEAGLSKSRKDPRFLVELAGILYRQNDYRNAKARLRAALRMNPRDSYAHQFLATIYFLEGNLEAALKYWNPEDKPRLRSVVFEPSLQLKEPLRDRAIPFNAPQILTVDAFLRMQTRLDQLGIFSSRRIELLPADSGTYDVKVHLAERNGWGDSKGIVSLFGGLPYATVYPGLYNLGHDAVNLTSLARWDSEKRRISLAASMPLYDDPSLRLLFYADVRNENWNLTETLFSRVAPLTDLNMRRAAAGAEVHSVMSSRWSWSTGGEIANRNFRNLAGHTSSAELPFFSNSTSLSGWLGTARSLFRLPERRFTLDASAQTKAGREFRNGLGPFATLRGFVRAHWHPRAKGDDYEIETQVRAGATAGKATLDELFQLGVERDNDLWLRGHAGTIDSRKGAAPLGRRYFLANWEMDKNIYQNGFFTVKLGPFVDSGAVADSSGLLGSRRWLWDSGGQSKVRLLGSLTVVLSYGRDLHSGKGVFYGTVLR